MTLYSQRQVVKSGIFLEVNSITASRNCEIWNKFGKWLNQRRPDDLSPAELAPKAGLGIGAKAFLGSREQCHNSPNTEPRVTLKIFNSASFLGTQLQSGPLQHLTDMI